MNGNKGKVEKKKRKKSEVDLSVGREWPGKLRKDCCRAATLTRTFQTGEEGSGVEASYGPEENLRGKKAKWKNEMRYGKSF